MSDTKIIEVDWTMAFMASLFFDLIKAVLYGVVVGVVVVSITNLLAGATFWLILKKGGVQSPMKDLRKSFGLSLIPLGNLAQWWTYKMFRLKKEYTKQNTKARTEAKMARLKERARAQMLSAVEAERRGSAARPAPARPISNLPPPPQPTRRVAGAPLIA